MSRSIRRLGRGRVTYAGGVVGSEGIIHTGIGPFAIQPGSVSGYAKVGYRRDALKVGFFTNLIDADAPNLLLADPSTNQPIQLNFKTQTYDVEVGDSRHLGLRHCSPMGATSGATTSTSPSRRPPRIAPSWGPTFRTRSSSIASASRSAAASTSSAT